MVLPLITNRKARHIFLDRHGLGAGQSGSGKGQDLQNVIGQLSFVQLDSINTVARAHHMILHARRQSYRAPALDARLAARGLFEHWTHDASVIDMAHFPHWKLKFTRDADRLRSRWSRDRRAGFEQKFDDILEQIAKHGPCCSSDVGEGEARGSGGWWDWHPSKTALEYLWRSGQLSVTRREGFRKFYDLTENVIPKAVREATYSVEQTVDWACSAALDRLGFATSGELAAFWDLLTPAEAKAWCAQALSDGRIIEIEVENADRSRRIHFARPDLPEVKPPPGRARILSPFDPALRDRNRAERLFGFHYRIEVFVPEAKRQYGYYVFPVLEGDRLIGRIDMKCDRKSGVLNVTRFWPERAITMSAARRARLQTAIENTARFAKMQTVAYPGDAQTF